MYLQSNTTHDSNPASLIRKENVLQQTDIKAEDILSTINVMEMNKTGGSGKFYPRTMKEAKNEMVTLLIAFFNKSFTTAKFQMNVSLQCNNESLPM